MKTIVRTLLSFEFVGELDATSWFHQFGLCDALMPWFGLSVGSLRFQQVTLPMGWNCAPAVAQEVCLLLCTLLSAQAYIDNIFPAGNTLQEATEVMDTVLTRADSIGAKFKVVTTPVSSLSILGLHLDCVHKRYRLDEDWLDKVLVHWDVQARSRLQWAVLCGQLVYALYVTSRPLGLVFHTLFTLAGWSSAALPWSNVLPPTPGMESELPFVYAMLKDNAWVVGSSSGPTGALVSADASPTGGAGSFLSDTLHMSWAWRWEGEDIPQIQREAAATLMTLELAYHEIAALPEGLQLLVVNDAIPWLQILGAGLSRSPTLQSLSNACWAVIGQRHFQTAPVCSGHHWDDAPSRVMDINSLGWTVHSSVFPPSPPFGHADASEFESPSQVVVHSCDHTCSQSLLLELFMSQCVHGRPCAFCV